MQTLIATLRIFGAFLLSLLLLPASHAQVYKWVDAKGQTHYSTRKEDAGGARTNEVKLPPQPAQPPAAKNPAEYSRGQNNIPPPLAEKEAESPPKPKPPRSLSGGREDGTDASRCALARDVLSGAVRHSNGKPTDKYDIDVAQSDIRAFCR
ncbi:DUF4124 domain-containing protein [Polaromonas aquatica]|uniref:DUF4124 domain-containing protein n=1 Tax=Polaromonas aquatica TaxID=332657 RepID=UPI003D658641